MPRFGISYFPYLDSSLMTITLAREHREIEFDVQWAYSQKAGHRADKAQTNTVNHKSGRIIGATHSNVELAKKHGVKCLGKGPILNCV